MTLLAAPARYLRGPGGRGQLVCTGILMPETKEARLLKWGVASEREGRGNSDAMASVYQASGMREWRRKEMGGGIPTPWPSEARYFE